MAKVFISYRHISPDEELAAKLKVFLEGNGLEVFIDSQILVGRRWVEEIDRQLKTSGHFIVLLSAESIRSDMLRQEVADSHALANSGTMRVYPIRLAFEEPLPYDLGSYLNPLQFLRWRNGDSWDLVCARVLEAIRKPETATTLVQDDAALQESHSSPQIQAGAPLPAADPRMDTGAVGPDSSFYVKRSEDDEVMRLASVPGRTVLIKGPRQVGKTSLLTRAKAAAEQSGHRLVYLDFQLIDETHLASLKTLALYIAHRIARTLRTTMKPTDVWDDYLGAPESLTDFLEQAVLADDSPITICCDEVDRIFEFAYRNTFFGMVRAWHNRRAQDAMWRRFGMIIAHSTEPALFIDNLNESPFNVGEVFRLSDFDRGHLTWLNQRHGRPLTSQGELETLQALVGGHPYLVRQAFYVLASKRVRSLADLIVTAAEDAGPFGDHLKHHLVGLSRRPRMGAAFKMILREGRCEDESDFQRLLSAGLTDGPSRGNARARCGLYQQYFTRHL